MTATDAASAPASVLTPMARTLTPQTVKLAVAAIAMAVGGLAPLAAASGWEKGDPYTPAIVIGSLLFAGSVIPFILAMATGLRDWLRRSDERTLGTIAAAIDAWGPGVGPAPGTNGQVIPLSGLRSLTRVYRGRTGYAVATRHSVDAAALADRGFRQVDVRYEGGSWTTSQTVLGYVGFVLVPYLFLAKPPRRRIVTYERDDSTAMVGDGRTVLLACAKCSKAIAVPAVASRLDCPYCRSSQQFFICAGCGAVCQAVPDPVSRTWGCEFCGRANPKPAVGGWPTGDADRRLANLAERSVSGGAPYSLVGGFLVLGGSGYGLAPGSRLSVAALQDRAILTREEADGHETVVVPYAELTALDTSGGKQTSSPGFIGGGFGLTGAAKGIAVASVLNAALSTTSVNTGVHIASTRGEVLLHHPVLESQQIRLRLSSLWAGYAAAQHVSSRVSTADPATLLARLGELRVSGVLTEQEFEAKKRDLLDRM